MRSAAFFQKTARLLTAIINIESAARRFVGPLIQKISAKSASPKALFSMFAKKSNYVIEKRKKR